MGRFSNSFLFILGVSFFMLGILLGSLLFKSILILPFFIVILFFFVRKPIYLLALVSTFVIGALYINFAEIRFQKSATSFPVELSGRSFVVVDPSETGKYNLTITARTLDTDQLVIIKTRQPISVHPGDVVSVDGVFQRPDDDDLFSYQKYLKARNIIGLIEAKSLQIVGSRTDLLIELAKIREEAVSSVHDLLPEPSSSLLAGLLIGARGGLRGELLDAFNATGTSHIVAISGFNISIIIAFVMAFFRRKSLRSFVITSGFIVLFTLLVGAGASVVRAALMGIVLSFASNLVGRKSHNGAVLFLASLLMLITNPLLLRNDLSFILSFLAVAGIIFYSEPMERFIPFKGWLNKILVPILCAGLFTSPIILLAFGRLSIVAPLANLLIVLAVVPAMLFGAIALALSMISLELGRLAALVADFFLQFILNVVTKLSSIDNASLEIRLPSIVPGLLLLALIYLLYVRIWEEELNVRETK